MDWAVAVVLQLRVLFLEPRSVPTELTTRSNETSEDFREQPGLLRELWNTEDCEECWRRSDRPSSPRWEEAEVTPQRTGTESCLR